MAGLLDFIQNNQGGLLGLSSALLQASGRSRNPQSFGQALGQGLLGFQQGNQQDLQQQLLQQQLLQQQQQIQERGAFQDTLQGLGGFIQAGQDTGQPITPQEVNRFLLNSPSTALQQRALDSLTPKAKEGFTLGEGQVRFDAAGNVVAKGPKKTVDPTKRLEQKFKNESALRGEFTKITKNFSEINNAFGRIKASVSDPSAAGDLSLLFNYMKMLDPESVVRESEFATVASSGSLGERVQGLVGKLMTGERLAPSIRQDFIKRAGKLFNEANRIHSGRRKEFDRLARRQGLDPENVLFQRNFNQTKSFHAPVLKRSVTQEEIEQTAINRGIPVDEVKRRLGIQ